MPFEKNIKELEKTVLALESGELPLDKAVELYSKGMELSLSCRKELDEAKLKITGDNSRSDS